MNREIKFRAWDKGDKVFQKDFVVKEGKVFLAIYDRGDYYKLIKTGWILQQYTGLHDKNKKEIYEGDVLQWGYGECKECGQEHKKIRGEIYWNEFGASYQTSNGSYLISNHGNTQLKGNGERDDLEIIGNIYENPELIKLTLSTNK